MIETLSRESFQPLLESEFEIDFGTGPVTSELIDVRSLAPPSDDHEGRLPWSILFRTATDAQFEQSTYNVRHPQLGELALFLVPVGPDKQGMRYEAVFT